MELCKNEYFILSAQDNTVSITVFAPQYPLRDFENILKLFPRIQITNFPQLRNAVLQATGARTDIGTLKPAYELQVANDYMEASVKLNLTDNQWQEQRAELIGQIIGELRTMGITEGIMYDVFNGDMPMLQPVIIARGIEPQHGDDAQITYYEISERKPTIRQDGSADYYEMHFIDEVQPGDWLGEKIPPTNGTPGRNLKGFPIAAKNGRDKPLQYDSKVISESIEEGGKTVLRSLVTGGVQRKKNKITVEEILTINGDVGLKTGNIDYDGTVKIIGTIHDGYSVTATKDISILSEMGIGAAGSIISKEGDIFVKGGVFGKGRATIHAGQNVYMKHAQECTITAAESIHIGLYAIGCNLEAKYILLDKYRGKVIGGHVHAKVQIVTAFIGNELERPTKIEVEGFNRTNIMKELEIVLQEYKKVLADLEKLRKEVDLYEEYVEMLKDSQKKEYVFYSAKHDDVKEKVIELEERRKKLSAYLTTKGDGEVTVLRKAFPRTVLQIKAIEKRIEQIMTGSFYVSKSQLFHE